MDLVSLTEATNQLAALVERAAQGHDVAITVDGVPVARLTRLHPGKRPIQFGVLQGQLVVPANFDEPLPSDVLERFVGGEVAQNVAGLPGGLALTGPAEPGEAASP